MHDVISAAFLASTDSPAAAVQGTPPAYRKKAARLVGGKCTLLARIDAYGQDPTGSSGASMKVQRKPEPLQMSHAFCRVLLCSMLCT